MQPSDSLPPSATPPVPLAVAYPVADACSVPHEADDTCVLPTCRASETALRKTGVSTRKGEGLPGYEAILFVRAMVEHPAGYGPLLAPLTQRAIIAFDVFQHSRHPERNRFRGRSPTARTFACLRIADGISATVARLATGSGGLTLGRAGFAPAG